ncbi:dTMP kinase [Methanocalculus taiwanensis]|uniref:dTMP kinase n=1 Tax=Methanocalculus taiwanensis TaxID=106207 RepID=UPI0034CF70D3
MDGSGKSTLIKRLENRLSDLNCVFTREPGATWIGKAVRQAIAEETDPISEALLFVADHAMHLKTIVWPALDDGRIVISDRFTDSRFAYQQVTLSGVIDDPGRWLAALHEGWSLTPDLTFLLIIPPARAIERIDREGVLEHFEREEVLAAVQQVYLSRARVEPERFVLIDAEEEMEEIASFVAEEIRRVCGSQEAHRQP